MPGWVMCYPNYTGENIELVKPCIEVVTSSLIVLTSKTAMAPQFPVGEGHMCLNQRLTGFVRPSPFVGLHIKSARRLD